MVREIQLLFTVIFISLRLLGNISIEFSSSVLHLHIRRKHNKHFRKVSYVPSMIQLSQVNVAISDHEQEYFSSVGEKKEKCSRPYQNSQDCVKSNFCSFHVQKFTSEVWLHVIYFAYERNSLMTFHINNPLSL